LLRRNLVGRRIQLPGKLLFSWARSHRRIP
jgi:hypothetical protein